MQQDEYSIIKECRDGNSEAYAVLVERYKGMVYNIGCRMLKDSEAARDVAQESFISAYGALRDFRYNSKFSTWLCSIAINKCQDHLRSRKNNISLEETNEQLACKTPDPEEAACRRERKNFLQEALYALPGSYRELIILKHLEGLDYKEMEKILGTKANVLRV